MTNSRAYQEGWASYEKNQKWADNPYVPGSGEWQDWINGKSDASDEDFLKLVKEHPGLLIDK